MLSEEALNQLYQNLKKNNYVGSLDDLCKNLILAKKTTELKEFYSFLGVQSNFKQDKNKTNEVKSIIEGLIKKYTITKIDTFFGNGSLYFSGKRHPTKDSRYIISIKLINKTNSGSNGFYGEKIVIIQWGYDKKIHKKTFCLIEKEPY